MAWDHHSFHKSWALNTRWVQLKAAVPGCSIAHLTSNRRHREPLEMWVTNSTNLCGWLALSRATQGTQGDERAQCIRRHERGEHSTGRIIGHFPKGVQELDSRRGDSEFGSDYFGGCCPLELLGAAGLCWCCVEAHKAGQVPLHPQQDKPLALRRGRRSPGRYLTAPFPSFCCPAFSCRLIDSVCVSRPLRALFYKCLLMAQLNVWSVSKPKNPRGNWNFSRQWLCGRMGWWNPSPVVTHEVSLQLPCGPCSLWKGMGTCRLVLDTPAPLGRCIPTGLGLGAPQQPPNSRVAL